MPPRFNLFSARSLLRSTQYPSPLPRETLLQQSYKQCAVGPTHVFAAAAAPSQQRRMNSSSSSSKKDQQPEGADTAVVAEQPQETLPHASEEAAEISRIMEGQACGEVGGPELEQGTPVVDILKRDKEALKNMPKVLRDQLAASGNNSNNGSRSFSTSARMAQQEKKMERQEPELAAEPTVADIAEMMAVAAGNEPGMQSEEKTGHKFGIPAMPIPRSDNMKRRYDPLVEHFTKLIMESGKLAMAQKTMDTILDHLRTAAPPRLDTRLLPGPSASQLPLDPVAYLTLVVDSVAPIVKIRQQKGAAGGGRALPIPIPLSQRQRRRTAIMWIIQSSEKKRDPQLAKRLVQEIVSVAEGKSSIWDKRAQVHKAATSARVNVMWKGR